MAIADTKMWHSCVQLLGTTPQTITPTKATHGLSIDNDTTAKVYVVFNWLTGDTEVSATNFDKVVAAGGSMTIERDGNSLPDIKAYRVLGSATGYLGNLGW